MSILDLQAFLQERLSLYDANIDTGSGSNVDNIVIQPLLRRLGPDPFAVDVRAFLLDRLTQEFPDFSTRDGDALTDMLVKPTELFLDPVVRENQRVKNNLSFRDPATLTVDEAEALGANFFSERHTGKFASGVCRVYFSQPQSKSINPANVCISRSGLSFFPTSVQSISVDEMLFNVEGGLYYFDVNVSAEQAGDQYNIEPGELATIQGLDSAVRVTNKGRFKNGIAAETAVDYINRVQQELTERSLVTKRGIVAQLMKNFPEMTRLNVVGFNDPEMHRDIIEGGGLGKLVRAGLHGLSQNDGDNKATTRRFKVDTALDGLIDFVALIGPPGFDVSAKGYTITLSGAFLGAPPARDFVIKSVVDPTTVDFVDQTLPLALFNITWSFRKSELTLSKIPGGILFPDSPNGTVTIPDGTIHVGGSADTYVRGTVLDTNALVINNVVDDRPVLSGVLGSSSGGGTVTLEDLILSPFPGANYINGDNTYEAIATAAQKLYTLQIMDGPAAGIYRIAAAAQPFTILGNPAFAVYAPFPVLAGPFRWRLLDIIDIDFVEPKETRISGSDLQTFQASTTVTTASGVNFDQYGTAIGDVLRIESGADVGDYTITAVTPFPNFSQLVLDHAVPHTTSGVIFTVFKPNKGGGVIRPFVRVTSINLLDASSQPIGSNIPYAKTLGGYSLAFSNPAKGIKVDITDTLLGVVGTKLPTGAAALQGKLLVIRFAQPAPPLPPLPDFSIVFAGANPISAANIVLEINAVLNPVVGPAAVLLPGNRVGIIPVNGKVQIIGDTALATSAIPEIFGDGGFPGALIYVDSTMARSDLVSAAANFFVDSVRPPIDLTFDVFQTIDGKQTGFFTMAGVNPYPGTALASPIVGLTYPKGISVNHDFAPEVFVHSEIGARSLGKTRLYFLEPTTVEVSQDTVFTATNPDTQSVLRYYPDPTLDSQHIPALPAGPKPHDGFSTVNTLSSVSTDFINKQIIAGLDILVVDYRPIFGTIPLPDPVVANLKTLIISFDNAADRVITFIHDSNAILPTEVTRAGIISQINSNIGKTIASLTGTNAIKFDPEVLIIIRGFGTANAVLGLPLTDVNNQSPHAGRYLITALAGNLVTVSPAFPAIPLTVPNQQFKVFRPGSQRIGATSMSLNIGPAGFYYWDVELVSEGAGDVYNIGNDIYMEPGKYKSDGYYLTTDNEDLVFSAAEEVRLHVSRTINEIGTDDDPVNSTQVSGQNIQVNYEYSSLTGSINSFLLAETERVICSSPLARHLMPHFIRFDLQYSGGPKVADVQPAIETLIQATFPEQQLEVSDISAILVQRGTESIVNPITLYGIVYENDRSVSLEKSEDRINLGRLAAFIPDRINLTRNLI